MIGAASVSCQQLVFSLSEGVVHGSGPGELAS